MKRSLLPLVAICLGLGAAQASWIHSLAVRGVVIGKSFRPVSLSHSLGGEGIYRFEVRDERNKIQRQMVSREVFEAYQIGDKFDSSAPPPNEKQQSAMQKAAASPTGKPGAPASAKRAAAPALAVTEFGNRLAKANFTRDMLPETEGF